MMTHETITTRCEARTGVTPGAFGFEPTRCSTAIGLREFVNAQAETHRFCGAPGHEDNVRLRFGGIGAMQPPRKASAGCESGGRPGCTCDVCF